MKPLTWLALLLVAGISFAFSQQTQYSNPSKGQGYVLPQWGVPFIPPPGTTPFTWPTVVSYGNEQLAMFYDQGSQVYVNRWQGGRWSDWESMGWTFGPNRQGLRIVSWSPNRMDAFTVFEGDLYHTYWTGGQWAYWSVMGGGNLAGDFHVVSWGPDRLDIFARTQTGSLKHLWYDHRWGEWEETRPQGGIRSQHSVRVVSWAEGRLDIFVVLDDFTMDHLWFDQHWGAWESLGGGTGTDFSVVCPVTGLIDIYHHTLDEQLSKKSWTGSAWTPWIPLGVPVKSNSSLVAISRGIGKTDLFFTQPSSAIGVLQFEPANGLVQYHDLGGATLGGLAAAAWSPYRLDVFVIGTDKLLYHMPWDGKKWGY